MDFLPEWYKENRRRRLSAHRQYLALGVLFLIMAAWNARAMRSISMAGAEVAAAEPRRMEAEQVCTEFDDLVRQLGDRWQELRGYRDRECRVDVAGVWADLSEVIDGCVALETLDVVAEPAGGDGRDCRIVLKGLAHDPPAVAALLNAMEGSAHFRQVTLVVSRDLDPADPQARTVEGGPSQYGVAFEIRCLVNRGGGA